ncbi:hypothetical protein D8W73_15545 [Citrobacter amalonaticus]|nr:hypothetical protein [Citrobacter amalonaticus]
MDIRAIITITLCAFSPFGLAKQNCETIAGYSAGAADYRYESAEVKTDSRLHFYSAPAADCQLPTFLAKGDIVEVLRSSLRYESEGVVTKEPHFRYVRYRDTQGAFATGWVSAEGLASLTSPLPVSPSCLAWADKAMPQRETKPPVADNQYQINGNARAWFYTMPDEQCRSHSVFLITGDIISAQEESNDNFIEAVYYRANRHIVRGWLKKSQLRPLNTADHYRDDINPLSTDKAVRVVTLNLRNDYQCVFYESWNEEKSIQIIVREDHQSERCRGNGDPRSIPAVAYPGIDKLSGKVTWADITE